MKIIEPSAILIKPVDPLDGVLALIFIEKMGRISHRSEDKQTESTWKPFIESVVLKHGDWSIVEHATATAQFRVDRGVTHELVRHRLFSFTQESTRFVRYGGKLVSELEFIMPRDIAEEYCKEWMADILKRCADAYDFMVRDGVRPQEARAILPNALASTIVVTGNLRNWRHFFLMRTTTETHPDFRRVTIPLLEEFKRVIPLLYDDIEPNARQIDNLRKPK